MVSGGRVFDSLLGINYHVSLLIVAGVTILYTLFGGFLAVSWTDVVQGGIMMLALLLVPVFALAEVGGVTTTFDQVRSIDPQLLDVFRGVTIITIIGSCMGAWLFWTATYYRSLYGASYSERSKACAPDRDGVDDFIYCWCDDDRLSW